MIMTRKRTKTSPTDRQNLSDLSSGDFLQQKLKANRISNTSSSPTSSPRSDSTCSPRVVRDDFLNKLDPGPPPQRSKSCRVFVHFANGNFSSVCKKNQKTLQKQKNRERMAEARAKMTEKQRAVQKQKDRDRMAKTRAKMTEKMKVKKKLSNVPSPHIPTPNVSPMERKGKLHEEEDYQLKWETIYEDQVFCEATPPEESDNERARRTSKSDNSDWDLDNQNDKNDENQSNKTLDSEWSFGINADEEACKDFPKTMKKETNCHSSITNCALDHEEDLFGDPEIFDPYIIQDSPVPTDLRQSINTPERLKLKAPDDKTVCTPTTGPQYPDFLESSISSTNDHFPDFASNNNDAKEYLTD
ncbi:hypothetical protein DdX_05965 [Ditylenchus destructor]|uniref:Uncharacterized protein n=1 Tax=Ditylenchus destructor TaxID=166010 RepID=A0AAD4R665_9BILA|nr:hypothetical protein DdX_05965 [Ditylenchus destructor]